MKKRRAQICDQIQRLIKFLQDYAGRRVRQTRTPNISAERKFTNLIKLKQYRVKRLFHPRLPHADVKPLLFAPDATRSVTGKQKHNKQKNEERQRRCVPSVDLSYVKLCDTAALVHKNELLTPVLRADVSTGKLDSRFPVNKPQVLQIKVC